MLGRKSTSVLLFILSITFVFILGLMALTGTDGIVIGPLLVGYPLILTVIGTLIAGVILVYIFQHGRLSTDRP